jgi:hypothetical protein
MKVTVASILPCHPDHAWDEVQKSALLEEIAGPLVMFRPVGAIRLPDRWQAGTHVYCRSYLFGFLPLGTRNLFFERIDAEEREIRTRESDPLVRRWDHTIRLRPTADGRTLYSDAIEIQAGIFTLPVWLFAQWFYRHRQRRWIVVAKRIARTKGASDQS